MLRRFHRDHSGVTAVEFALIAPAVILIYFAMTQLIVGMAAERRASHAASAIADLVAQNANTSPEALDAVMRVGPSIMEPFPADTPAPLKMRITSVVVNAQGAPSVAWSRGDGLGALAKDAPVNELPPELRTPGNSYIFGQVQYDFALTFSPTLLKKVFGTDVWSFERSFFLRPRRGAAVTCSDC